MITIYSKPDGICMQCKMTAKLLEENNAEFTESKDPANVEILKDLGYSSYPVTMDDTGTTVVGFQPDKLRAMINTQRNEKKNAQA